MSEKDILVKQMVRTYSKRSLKQLKALRDRYVNAINNILSTVNALTIANTTICGFDHKCIDSVISSRYSDVVRSFRDYGCSRDLSENLVKLLESLRDSTKVLEGYEWNTIIAIVKNQLMGVPIPTRRLEYAGSLRAVGKWHLSVRDRLSDDIGDSRGVYSRLIDMGIVVRTNLIPVENTRARFQFVTSKLIEFIKSIGISDPNLDRYAKCIDLSSIITAMNIINMYYIPRLEAINRVIERREHVE